MHYLNYMLVICLFGLISCSCPNFDIKPIKVQKAKDKYLSCKELEVEILNADFQSQYSKSRADIAEAYAQYPTCIVSANLAIEKNINDAESRVEYLKRLKCYKKCQ